MGFIPESNMSTNAGWSGEQINQYHVAFRAILACVLVIETLAGIVSNLFKIAIKHWSLGSSPYAFSSSRYLDVGQSIIYILTASCCTPMTLSLILSSRYQSPNFCFFHSAIISFVSSASTIISVAILFDEYYKLVSPSDRKISLRNIQLLLVAVGVISLVGFGSCFQTKNQIWIFQEERNNSTRDSEVISFENHQTMACFVRSNGPLACDVYLAILYLSAIFTVFLFYLKIVKHYQIHVHFQIIIAKSIDILSFVDDSHHVTKQTRRKGKNRIKQKVDLLRVVMVCFVLWGPYILSNVLACIFTGPSEIVEMIQLLCLSLSYLSCILNPLATAIVERNGQVPKKDMLKGSAVTTLQIWGGNITPRISTGISSIGTSSCTLVMDKLEISSLKGMANIDVGRRNGSVSTNGSDLNLAINESPQRSTKNQFLTVKPYIHGKNDILT